MDLDGTNGMASEAEADADVSAAVDRLPATLHRFLTIIICLDCMMTDCFVGVKQLRNENTQQDRAALCLSQCDAKAMCEWSPLQAT